MPDMSKRRIKAQPNTLKIWRTQHGTAWASIEIHDGRVTRRVSGPEANDPETSVDMLRSILNEDT